MTTITHVNIGYNIIIRTKHFCIYLLNFMINLRSLIWNHFFFYNKPDTHTCRLISGQWCAHGQRSRVWGGDGVRIQIST